MVVKTMTSQIHNSPNMQMFRSKRIITVYQPWCHKITKSQNHEIAQMSQNHEITKLHMVQCHSWNNYDTFQSQIQIVDGNLTNTVNAPNWLQRHCQCLTTATMTATTTNSSRTKLVNISPEYSQESAQAHWWHWAVCLLRCGFHHNARTLPRPRLFQGTSTGNA